MSLLQTGKLAAIRRWLNKPVRLPNFTTFVVISSALWLATLIFWLRTVDPFAATSLQLELKSAFRPEFGVQEFPYYERHLLGAGFVIANWTRAGTVINGATFHLTIPYVMLFVLFSILPVEFARRRFNAYQCRKCQICPNCEYDLRASTDRCPECGTRIT